MALVSLGKPSGVSAAVSWIHGGSLCGGADDQSGTVYLGIKNNATCADHANRPAEYITMAVEGLAALRTNASAYLTNNSALHVIEATSFIGPLLNSFNESSIEYGRVMLGARMGQETDSAFGFIGTASYLVQRGSFAYNTNDFVVPSGNTNNHETVSGICVVPIASNGNCGANRTAQAGTYKFSLYGYTGGSGFTTEMAAYTHLGARQLVNLTGMGAGASVTFNSGGVALSAMGSTSVTSLVIRGATTTMSYAFPTTYNVGSIATGTAVPAASPTVIIHASPHPTDAKSFHLDYVFALANGLQNANGYFVYDPDVTAGGGSTSSSTSSTSGTSASSSPAAASTSTAPRTPATCMSLIAGLSAVALFVH